MQKYKKCQKWKSSKTHHFRRFQPKWIAPLNSAYFFRYCSTGQNWFSTFFQKWHFLDIRIVKSCMFLMIRGLGTMLERFFIGKSFRLHISKPKNIPGNILVDISKVIKSSRRGLSGKIFDKLRIQGRMQIFEKMPQKALNYVLIL